MVGSPVNNSEPEKDSLFFYQVAGCSWLEYDKHICQGSRGDGAEGSLALLGVRARVQAGHCCDMWHQAYAVMLNHVGTPDFGCS